MIASNDCRYAPDDVVMSPDFPVAEYAVVPSALIMRKINPDSGVPLTEYLGCIGKPFS